MGSPAGAGSPSSLAGRGAMKRLVTDGRGAPGAGLRGAWRHGCTAGHAFGWPPLLAGPARLAGHRLPRLARSILLLNAFWAKDPFTGNVEPFTGRLARLPDDCSASPVYRHHRHADGRAWPSLVTITDAAARLPDRLLHGAHRLARASGALLVVAVLIPLWAAYLVKVYAWRIDPAGQRPARLGRSTPFGIEARADATSATPGSCSATCGCRT